MERIDCKKEFLKVFNSLCYSRSAWQVWSDFITASACSIANAVDKGKHFEERENSQIGHLGMAMNNRRSVFHKEKHKP